ncbi:MAG TPA: 16S rRNA (adenine(1518)-N(6)/adenine(1519)-N(6))-dimethyltransferase RsmA [Myxococcota bacterium]|jgi:16S rRNA (adenine1518-N6/adenine1519-N6)-dimethyltransferase|nr:16S rRNA (adenine(1518)-N(6)/adenine(1519)-N(6))-dimethyltransferase RsmA [Myxococcota bacterium]
MSVAEVRAALERHGLAARRDLGQNFLVDPAIAQRLVTHAGVTPADVVIEIGPGLGLLTRALAARAARVVAIEVDAGLVRALRAEGALPGNVELRHADALAVDLAAMAEEAEGPARVVANLPYAISSPLLRRLLDARHVLADWSVMVQREVAERVQATPGSRDYGSLAVLHHLCVRASRGIDLAPGCFFPVPRVSSRFFRLSPRGDTPVGRDELERVERVARAAFGQRRKTLVNALRGGLVPSPTRARIEAALEGLGLDPRVRAEALAPETFLALARILDLDDPVAPAGG